MSFWDTLFGQPQRTQQDAALRDERTSTSPVGVVEKNKESEKKQEPREKRLSLEEELEEAWDYVQNRIYCYDLPFPKITETGSISTACIDMSNHEISIRKDFVDYLSSRGLDNQTILKGVLLHEAGHFKIIPWDLKNLLLMQFFAAKVCAEKKDMITNYFMDVSLNLDLMLKKREDSIHEVYKAMEKKSRIDTLLSHLYSLKTGFDFSSPHLPFDLHKPLKELGKLKFTNKKKIYPNLKRFAEIVKDVIDEDTRKNKCYSPSNMDDFNLKAYDKNEVERAMKEIAKEMKSPVNYKKVYGFVSDELKKDDLKKEKNAKNNCSGGLETGPGTSITQGYDASNALIHFYTSKAETYEVEVQDKSVLGGGSAVKSEIKSWETDDSYLSVDVFNSYGKFFPEITKSWKEAGNSGEKITKATPDLLVMIDSSGSMTNPDTQLSNAALGGLCATRQYLKRGSKIGVVNFGDETKITAFTRDYDTIAKKILHYQCGGTELITNDTYNLITKNNKEVDIMLISDGFINNYGQVMNELNKRKNTHRITILEIMRFNVLGGFSGGAERFKSSKIQVYTISKEEDIPGIVINDLNSRGLC